MKEGGHAIVPSSSLIPDDPSVLLTTAGMQQFKKYYTGELDARRDFGSQNTASIQKSFRTSDIDEVGDERHLTFFEMLGNFSFGGYFKERAIELGHEFITKVMKLEIDYVTVFDPEKVPNGDWRKGVPFDHESFDIWKKRLPEAKIRREGVDNFWGPTGSEGPCGPTTEIYVRGVEIWNLVFNQFFCSTDKKLTPLKTPGVDTGMGLERLAMVSQNVPTIFETDLLDFLIREQAEQLSDISKRIIADHARAIVFLVADGVMPSNKDAGYILRRILRRYIVKRRDATGDIFTPLQKVIDAYRTYYDNLDRDKIFTVVKEEYERFNRTLNAGIKEVEKIGSVDAKTAFDLFQSYGLPYEVIRDLGGQKTEGLKREDFDKEFAKHQDISRAGQEKKFGGHGLILNTGELKAGNEEELKKVLRLHTATHLLQAGLRKVLGPEVGQRGSDVTAERTRFDFAFPRKLTAEEIKAVEDFMSDAIKRDLPVNFVELPKEEAEKTGALYFFKEKYPARVKVYYVGETLESAISKEFCGGPHVKRTGEVGGVKVAKEESVGAGMRRIRAVLR